ncbi:hypothetical protein [Mycoplasma suis]|uniref:hypothetical protein n=1 Tax=Mycoplasma suis TaxID=57372 RepID=UPI001E636CCF|nr:hypothetical protein [Mycoplasma suis]
MTVTLAPILGGLYFYDSSTQQSGTEFQIKDLGGFTTRVNLFLKGFDGTNGVAQAASVGAGGGHSATNTW